MGHITQAEIDADVRKLRGQLSGRAMAVTVDGDRHRLACTVRGCGWSKFYGEAADAVRHLASH